MSIRMVTGFPMSSGALTRSGVLTGFVEDARTNGPLRVGTVRGRRGGVARMTTIGVLK